MQIEEILEQKKKELIFKRCFDLIVSFFSLIVLLPFFLLIGVLIKMNSKGPIFFKQIRVGKKGERFEILKFRTMIVDAEKKGMLITVGEDKRITKIGKVLRKSKLDELPQLINVFWGDMSFVGPRPEVPKYVELYDDYQKKILLVRPGITDLASIEFRNENELLGESENPEKIYIEKIMVKKIQLNYEYIENMSFLNDLKLIFLTLIRILRK